MEDVSIVEPGMWIAQNLTSHQSEYRVLRVSQISGNRIYFNIVISLVRTKRDTLPGSITIRESAVYDFPRHVLYKQNFRVIKRMRREIKENIFKTIFQGQINEI